MDAERARDLAASSRDCCEVNGTAAYAAHPPGAQRIDRHRGAQRGVDTAGQADDDAGKPFFST